MVSRGFFLSNSITTRHDISKGNNNRCASAHLRFFTILDASNVFQLRIFITSKCNNIYKNIVKLYKKRYRNLIVSIEFFNEKFYLHFTVRGNYKAAAFMKQMSCNVSVGIKDIDNKYYLFIVLVILFLTLE